MIAVPGLRASLSQSDSSAAIIVKQWHAMFETGKAQNPPIAVLTASAFLYLAWASRPRSQFRSLFRRPGSASLYLSAALLTIGIVPWTVVTMTKTNNSLIAIAEAAKTPVVTEVSELLKRWTSLNGVRSCFPLLGGVLGLFAILS